MPEGGEGTSGQIEENPTRLKLKQQNNRRESRLLLGQNVKQRKTPTSVWICGFVCLLLSASAIKLVCEKLRLQSHKQIQLKTLSPSHVFFVADINPKLSKTNKSKTKSKFSYICALFLLTNSWFDHNGVRLVWISAVSCSTHRLHPKHVFLPSFQAVNRKAEETRLLHPQQQIISWRGLIKCLIKKQC